MLSRTEILEALEALASNLALKGLEGRVFVVGGAAMALAFDPRRSTRDVDAIFEPKAAVYAPAKEVASDLALPEDWLNVAVRSFAAGADPEAIPVFERPGLSVSAASARYMLAMKLRAAKVEQDSDDIRFLAELLGLTSADEILSVAIERYDEKQLSPRARLLAEEIFEEPG